MATWGIMGGSFDPIHLGHLFMAEQALKHVQLDGVLFIPTGDPPHKSYLAKAEHRLAMVELAIAGNPHYRASDIEINRDTTTYTIDTLNELHALHPDDEYVYIVGADTLLVIETWYTFDLVVPLLKGIACIPRPDVDTGEALKKATHLFDKYGLCVWMMDQSGPDISSTEIRLRAERDQSLAGLVPEAVAEYIAAHHLYKSELLESLKASLTADRYRHTLGVEHTALQLAAKYGIDPGKVRMAALLHDCAKCMREPDMLLLLKKHNMEPKYPADRTRTLMHAAASMILAKEQYGVTDEDVLSAVRWHTTGHAGMTDLEKLIYLADMIEPGRRPFPALFEIRDATWQSLDQGIKLAAARSLQYLDQRGILPDPHTIELLNDYQS